SCLGRVHHVGLTTLCGIVIAEGILWLATLEKDRANVQYRKCNDYNDQPAMGVSDHHLVDCNRQKSDSKHETNNCNEVAAGFHLPKIPTDSQERHNHCHDLCPAV